MRKIKEQKEEFEEYLNKVVDFIVHKPEDQFPRTRTGKYVGSTTTHFKLIHFSDELPTSYKREHIVRIQPSKKKEVGYDR